MGQIGEELERARKQKGLSLHDVENATKIRVKYLDALESEDYEVLPGRVYIIGFMRTYAKFLGLDDELLVSQFKEKVSPPPFREEEPPVKQRPVRKTNKKRLLFLMLCALALVVGAVYVLGLNDQSIPPQDNTGNIQQPSQEPSNENTQDAENNGGQLGGETERVSVTVNIKDSDCWIDVAIDGKSNFRGTLASGDSRTFTGISSIKIRYGNAGAAEVVFNGRTEYPVGQPGQAITKEYTLNNHEQ